ncbi:NUDIX domain-containing protein [Streptomyces sp. NPDC002851]
MPDTTRRPAATPLPLTTLERLPATPLLHAERPYATPHCQQWPWHPDPVPARLPVKQAWGWLFVPDGRCIVLIDTEDWLPLLPGGTIEPDADGGSPLAALEREAAEEAQLSLADPVYLGYVYDAEGAVYGGIGPCARVRMAARVTQVGPAAPDPASGQTLLRVLAPPQRAVELFGWGEQAQMQAKAAERIARDRWGLPAASDVAVREIPAEGFVL